MDRFSEQMRELARQGGDFDDEDLLGLEPEVDNLTVYVPPGPTSQAYLNDHTASKFLMGPVGGGKTTTVAFGRILDGAQQGLAKDGWVRDRALVLRKTWRTAKRTVLKSWQEWFAKNYAGSTWTGGEDRPATHVLRFEDPSRFGSLNPVKVELETEFMGLDDNNIDAILRGSPYSRIWLNESDQFSADIVEETEGRVGRYPKLDDLADGQVRTKGVMGDFNAPDKTNYLRSMLVEDVKPGRKLFTQPAGLVVRWNADGTLADYRINPLAENLSKLDKDYYTSKATNWETWRLRRLVLNEWGYSRDGLPVFLEEFVEALHVPEKALGPQEGLPLIIGADLSTGGLRPAAVFFQPDPLGYIRVKRTFAPGHGWGAVRFWEGCRHIVDTEFAGCGRMQIFVDPASQFGGDKEGGQLSAMDSGSVIMDQTVQVPFGGSNEIGMRLQVIRDCLTKVIQSNNRQLIIEPHPSNRILINGFASAYRFKKQPVGSSSQWDPLPDKKAPESDPMDALGYGLGGYFRIQPTTLARAAGRERRWGGSRTQQGWTADGQGLDGVGRSNDFDVFKY